MGLYGLLLNLGFLALYFNRIGTVVHGKALSPGQYLRPRTQLRHSAHRVAQKISPPPELPIRMRRFTEGVKLSAKENQFSSRSCGLLKNHPSPPPGPPPSSSVGRLGFPRSPFRSNTSQSFFLSGLTNKVVWAATPD